MSIITRSRPAGVAIRVPVVRTEILAVGALVLAAVGVPLVVASALGALGVPQGDDWAYYASDHTLLHGGGLHLLNWGEMTLVGHLLFGIPFLAALGDRFASLQWAGALAAAGCLVAMYALYRRFVPMRLALFGVATLAVMPIFLVLTVSFMTDLTALAGQFVCLALGVGALHHPARRRRLMLAAALAVGFFAFTSREVAIAAPLAVLAGHAVREGRRGRRVWPLLAAGAGLVVAALAFYIWRQGLPHGEHRGFAPASPRQATVEETSLWFSLAVLVVPVLVFGGRVFVRRAHSRLPLMAAVAVGVAGLVRIALGHGSTGDHLFAGDYLLQAPLAGFEQLGPTSPVIPGPAWHLIQAVALAAALVLAVFVVQQAMSAAGSVRMRRLNAFEPQTWIVVLFGLIATAFVVLRAATLANVTDRYLLPVAAMLILLLLSVVRGNEGNRAAWLRGAACLAVVAVVGMAFVTYVDSWNAARWHAGEHLVASGIPARDVDAGFEWVGFHYGGPTSEGSVPKNHRWIPPAAPYLAIFPRHGNCGTVSSTPRSEPWLRLVGRETWHTQLGLRTETLYLYRNTRACAATEAR